MLKNQRGMSLIEALVGNALLIMVIFASLSIFKDVVGAHVGSESFINYIVARNRLISNILDARGWNSTISAAENVGLACLLNQDQADPADRNCKTVTGATINIYSLDDEKIFPLQDLTAGISRTGVVCTGFAASPAAPNADCPMGMTMKVDAQCDPAVANCGNAPMHFAATFAANGDPKSTPRNTTAFNFEVIASGLYCPVQNSSVELESDGTTVATDESVNGVTAAQVGHYARSKATILPCRRAMVDFTINSFNYSPVAGNTTTACLTDEFTGTCLYSLVHSRQADGSFSFKLQENGVDVVTKPTWMTLMGGESFQFDIVNGMVKFCVDLRCIHFFENKLEGPFRVRFYPAISNIGLPIVENYETTTEEL